MCISFRTVAVHSNGELLSTLCEKRHDAVVVMDFITLVSVHVAVIALVGCIFTGFTTSLS